LRTWGSSGAGAAIRRAQAVSGYARRVGCGVDEADEALEPRISRRQLFGAAGVFAAAVPAAVAPRPTSRSGRGDARVVIVGAGIAGLGCAYRLWVDHGLRSTVYDADTVAGGRIRTLRGYFDDGQIVEEHAEFINPEHTATLALAAGFGLTLDNTNDYPAGTHRGLETFRFDGQPWPQAALNEQWYDWGWQLFHEAAFTTAPWPQLYNANNAGGRRFDQMSVTEWIEAYVPGGIESDFGEVCIAAVLDEFGGPADEQSSLNLVYLLGQDDSKANSFQPRRVPALGGANEKWHIHGGTDLLISGVLQRLPAGTVQLGRQLVAVRSVSDGTTVCTFQSDWSTSEVAADHVILALPFTTLRLVDLSGVSISPLHRRAIDEEPLGSNSKFFVQCRTRVWNADHATGNAYCDGVVQGAWDPTVTQPGEAGILAALPGGNLAAGWGARYGLTAAAGQPPAAMVQDYLQEFDQLFPGVIASYDGRAYYVWSPGEPHALGAYSYLKVGQYTGFNGIQGQQEGSLHFAGEHTSVNFQGYVEGALRSGYRCANEVVGVATGKTATSR
jgi:monoamine oxidase